MEVFSIISGGAKESGRVESTPTREYRGAERIPAAEIPSITGVRLLPDDVRATLVNISTNGLLVESPNALRPDLKIRIRFEGTFSPALVAGRVVRCTVAAMGPDGMLRYHIGAEFNAPIALVDPAAAAEAAAPPEPTPLTASAAPTVELLRNRW